MDSFEPAKFEFLFGMASRNSLKIIKIVGMLKIKQFHDSTLKIKLKTDFSQ